MKDNQQLDLEKMVFSTKRNMIPYVDFLIVWREHRTMNSVNSH